jgi:hypothetical protein
VVGEGWRVTSIERTAHPQFTRLTSARVLHVFSTPAADEVAFARERTAGPEALLALWVPRTSSTSCDEAVFVDHATDASVSSDAVLLKVDRFG